MWEPRNLSTVDATPTPTPAPAPYAPPTRFDVVVAFGSVQHSGLGRYGDPLRPFGDIEALSDAASILSDDGGLLLLSVPVGNDCLAFNMFRVYGRRRLPLLLYGWEVVAVVGLDDRRAADLYYVEKGSSRSTPGSAATALGRGGGVWGWMRRAFWRLLRGIFGAGGGGSSSAAAPAGAMAEGRLRRPIRRWEDGQCDGSMQNSPLFVLKKVPSPSTSSYSTDTGGDPESVDDDDTKGWAHRSRPLLMSPRRAFRELAKVRGLLGSRGGQKGPAAFPLFHRPR